MYDFCIGAVTNRPRPPTSPRLATGSARSRWLPPSCFFTNVPLASLGVNSVFLCCDRAVKSKPSSTLWQKHIYWDLFPSGARVHKISRIQGPDYGSCCGAEEMRTSALRDSNKKPICVIDRTPWFLPSLASTPQPQLKTALMHPAEARPRLPARILSP